MFCQYTIDLTDEQRSLLNISKMYDSIYEHPECPEERVIADDDMLDGWMIIQRKNAERSKKQKSLSNNDKINNASEVFLMTETKDDIKNVLDLNTEEGRMILQEKTRFISQNSDKTIEDFDLPNVQRELLMRARNNK